MSHLIEHDDPAVAALGLNCGARKKSGIYCQSLATIIVQRPGETYMVPTCPRPSHVADARRQQMRAIYDLAQLDEAAR